MITNINYSFNTQGLHFRKPSMTRIQTYEHLRWAQDNRMCSVTIIEGNSGRAIAIANSAFAHIVNAAERDGALATIIANAVDYPLHNVVCWFFLDVAQLSDGSISLLEEAKGKGIRRFVWARKK